jgi:hypothetical protein
VRWSPPRRHLPRRRSGAGTESRRRAGIRRRTRPRVDTGTRRSRREGGRRRRRHFGGWSWRTGEGYRDWPSTLRCLTLPTPRWPVNGPASSSGADGPTGGCPSPSWSTPHRSAADVRIAIVGSGVSGLVAAWLLHRAHDVTVFEARGRIGGHVHTVEVPDRHGTVHAVDTGFIVYNEHNYPLFTKLLDRLGVASQPSEMSFSVRCDRTGLEYNGSTYPQLFAQRKNLPAAFPPDALGHRPLQPAGVTRSPGGVRVRDPGRLPRARTLLTTARRTLSRPDGLCALVHPAQQRARNARGVLRTVLQPARDADRRRSAAVEGGAGRLGELCRRARGSLPRPHPYRHARASSVQGA